MTNEKHKENQDQVAVEEFNTVIGFIHEHFASDIVRLRDIPDDFIEFYNLWMLFPPSCLVYYQDSLGQARAYRTRQSNYHGADDGTQVYSLLADYLDTDGKSVGYVGLQVLDPIREFSGLRSIYDLPIYPLKRHRNLHQLEKQLLTQGEKVLWIGNRRLREYTGHAMTENDNERQEVFDEEECKGIKMKKFNVSPRLGSSTSASETRGSLD